MLEEYTSPHPKQGQILYGEILRIADNVVYIDVGAKRDAIVPHEEVDQLGEALLADISTGDEVPVYVIRTPVGDEELIVSLERGLELLDWERSEESKAADEYLELEVVGYNKGGLVVQFGRIQGFVPNSHIPVIKRIYNHEQRMAEKTGMVGSTLTLKIIEVDQQKRRLILSAVAAQKELLRRQLQKLEEGQIITGQINGITDYGAFVDLGEVTGLLHVSEIGWQHVDHPREVLSRGEEIRVLIKGVDVERERVSLSRKDLLPSPWHQFSQRYRDGDLVEAEITAVVDFGAFARVPFGIEGLIHESEIALADRDTPVDQILEPGQQVLVRLLNIDPDQERLGLSMRRVTPAEQIEWLSRRQAGQGQAELEEDEQELRLEGAPDEEE